MRKFRIKLAQNGRVVIPASCRKKLHLKAGEELVVRVENNELHLSSLKHSLQKAQTIVQSYTKNRSLVKKLHQLRHARVK